MRSGYELFGLEVEQASGNAAPTQNWFHIGVTHEQSDRREAGGQIRAIYLNLELNENARLAEIHLREGRRLVKQLSPAITGRTIDQDFDVSGIRRGVVRWPLTVALSIQFLTGSPIGKVTFLGAGLTLITADYDS